MTATALQDPPAGLEEFINLVLEYWDPGLKSPETAPGAPANSPFRKQRQEMQAQTRKKTSDAVKTLRRKAFYLPAGAVRTLEKLDLPEETRERALSLNFLAMAPANTTSTTGSGPLPPCLPPAPGRKTKPTGASGGWTNRTPAPAYPVPGTTTP